MPDAESITYGNWQKVMNLSFQNTFQKYGKHLIWLGLLILSSGWATQNGGLSERDKILYENRIEDLEAAQTRQKTKIASLETRIHQLEDTVTILARKTQTNEREIIRIEPETATVSADFDRRETVAVLPNDEEYQDIVIGEDKKRAYFGTPYTKTSSSSGNSRQPYENVVSSSDKLPAMGENQQESTQQTTSPMIFYQEGIDLYRQGNFEAARTKFEKFLATNPSGSYMDNVLYWIGECFYGQGLYHEAATYFHRVIQEYPNENKVPDALLKVALTYQKLGKLDSAREMLRYLMEAFPGTEAARVGKDKYQTLTQQ